MSRLHLLTVVPLVASILAGCGTHPAATPAARAPRMVQAAGVEVRPFDGPAGARDVLAYAGAAARQLDPVAMFMSLTGTKIDQTGVTAIDGTWVAQYVGSNVAPPAGQQANPYMPWIRRITVTVKADGHASVRQSKQQGLPLGVGFFDDVSQALDSADVLRAFHQQRPTATQGPIATMTLAGMVGSHHFAMLVWRVDASAEADDTPELLLDATSGQLIEPSDTTAPQAPSK